MYVWRYSFGDMWFLYWNGATSSRSWFPVPGPIDVDVLILIPLGQLQLEVLGKKVLKEVLCPMFLSHLGCQVDGAMMPAQML